MEQTHRIGNYRVGITYHSSKSLTKSSLNQTALILGKLFLRLGYSVLFVNTAYSQVPVLTLSLETACSEDLHNVTNLSLLIDIDGLIHGDARIQASSKTVVFLRTFLQFSEMDNSVYIENTYTPRSMEHVFEVWCWDVLNPPETIPSIQTLFPCPIRRVPFVWESQHSHRPLEIGELDFSEMVVHVTEENRENTSSAIIPLVAIRELCNKKIMPTAKYIIHNMRHIKDNKFLKENVLDNIKFSELPVTFSEDTKPVSYWDLSRKNSVVLSHSRFVPLRLSLLEAVSYGIPVVHNSTFIRDLHPALSSLYYKGNELSGVCSVFTDFKEKFGMFHSALPEIRARMTDAIGIDGKIEAWTSIMKNVPLGKVAGARDTNTFSGRPLSLKKSASASASASATVPKPVPLSPPKTREITVAFSDMWPGFPFEHNYFIDALQRENPSVIGVEYKEGVKCDVLLFGPFGSVWKTANQSVPKVYFSAENIPLPSDAGIALYLTSNSENNRLKNHIRIPTWHIFIDWFTTETCAPSTASSENPIRLPLHLATHPHPISFSKRSSFCGFVVSNPMCEVRNKAFEVLNSYRHVDSGGALYNNIGGLLSLKYPGGGGGDISKHHFFAEKQFSISFENSQADGYVTEKLLHAKMAGCVPLYWGSTAALTDFVPNSFITLSNPDLIVDIIKKLESRSDLCSVVSSTPILDADRVTRARNTMEEMSRAILGLVTTVMDTFVINLDSRKDRMESLEQGLEYTRISAVNGLQLKTLTPFLYKLFQRNTFHWKKSVMGCFMSHMMAWQRIVHNPTTLTPPTSKKYTLILEDDVRFITGWKEKLAIAMKSAPADADLLYLGGVLPPNKIMLPSVLKAVNDSWSTIKPNTLFSAVEMPVFHFCAYSYILTVNGANKLLSQLTSNSDRVIQPCDHFIMSAGLTTYVATPFLTYCYQEEDEKYCNAQFNNLLVKAEYDSNISNNVECFTAEEVAVAVAAVKEVKEVEEVAVVDADITLTVYTLTPHTDLYEKRWLEEILGSKIKFVTYECQTDKYAWYLVQRPHLEQWTKMFQGFEKLNVPFNVLHMSDEFCRDDVSFYSYSMCNSVIRNYLRGDVYGMKNVLTIPLGYHHKSKTGQKSFQDRTLTWSFHGTDWFGRSAALSTLERCVPYSCHLQPDWNHPTMTREEMYVQTLGNSKFCPILRGNNVETFRFYEALEAGCLPVTPIDDAMYIEWIEENMGLSSLYPWTNPIVTLSDLTTDYEAIRKKVAIRWVEWKDRSKKACLMAQITRCEPLE